MSARSVSSPLRFLPFGLYDPSCRRGPGTLWQATRTPAGATSFWVRLGDETARAAAEKIRRQKRRRSRRQKERMLEDKRQQALKKRQRRPVNASTDGE